MDKLVTSNMLDPILNWSDEFKSSSVILYCELGMTGGINSLIFSNLSTNKYPGDLITLKMCVNDRK